MSVQAMQYVYIWLYIDSRNGNSNVLKFKLLQRNGNKHNGDLYCGILKMTSFHFY